MRSTIFAEGVHPKKIADERLGHASIKLTMDLYGHVFEGSDKESADRMQKLFGDRPAGEVRKQRSRTSGSSQTSLRREHAWTIRIDRRTPCYFRDLTQSLIGSDHDGDHLSLQEIKRNRELYRVQSTQYHCRAVPDQQFAGTLIVTFLRRRWYRGNIQAQSLSRLEAILARCDNGIGQRTLDREQSRPHLL
jgi:hypothetical protein